MRYKCNFQNFRRWRQLSSECKLKTVACQWERWNLSWPRYRQCLAGKVKKLMNFFLKWLKVNVFVNNSQGWPDFVDTQKLGCGWYHRSSSLSTSLGISRLHVSDCKFEIFLQKTLLQVLSKLFKTHVSPYFPFRTIITWRWVLQLKKSYENVV